MIFSSPAAQLHFACTVGCPAANSHGRISAPTSRPAASEKTFRKSSVFALPPSKRRKYSRHAASYASAPIRLRSVFSTSGALSYVIASTTSSGSFTPSRTTLPATPPSSSANAPPVPRSAAISSARVKALPNSRARNARSTLTV